MNKAITPETLLNRSLKLPWSGLDSRWVTVWGKATMHGKPCVSKIHNGSTNGSRVGCALVPNKELRRLHQKVKLLQDRYVRFRKSLSLSHPSLERPWIPTAARRLVHLQGLWRGSHRQAVRLINRSILTFGPDQYKD